MDQISAAIMKKALDGLSVRYAFLAQNIANANSPDYQPMAVTFEEALRSAAAHGTGAIAQVKPEAHPVMNASTPAEMRLDLELADASQTAMRYRALLDILGRQMALHRAVVTEGAR